MYSRYVYRVLTDAIDLMMKYMVLAIWLRMRLKSNYWEVGNRQ